MCPCKPSKMVARSCILLFYMALENTEGRKGFQVKKFLPAAACRMAVGICYGFDLNQDRC